MAADRITRTELEAEIANPSVDSAIKRAQKASALCHDRGYHHYSRILADMASQIETARTVALEALEVSL